MSQFYKQLSFSTLIVITLLFFSALTNASDLEAGKISVKQAHELSKKGEITLIDIRSIEEWQQTGVAPQAVPITIHQKGGIPTFSKQLLNLLDGDKTKPVALICAGGVRSARVQKFLIKQGFSNVTDVTEGMVGGWFSKGWVDQGLPVKGYNNQ
ncbi:MAG: rhodanese-like domain-containing protein [Cellvibrionaceae bacterium]